MKKPVCEKRSVSPVRSSAAEYLTFIANTGEGEHSVEMRYQDENIWLTQKMMTALYDVSVAAINQHLKRIFEDGELSPDSVIQDDLITAADGKNDLKAVRQMVTKRQRATQLLDVSKQSVEIAIEDSEAAALAYLEAVQ